MFIKALNLHKCKYQIMGFQDKINNTIPVDVICTKCGKYGTIYIDENYKTTLDKQIKNGKILKLPKIAYVINLD